MIFARRLSSVLPTLVIVSVILFVILRVVPGDPALVVLLGPDLTGSATQEEIQATRQELGLDGSLPSQYFRWVSEVVQGDLGTSLETDEPVTKKLVRELPVTLELACISLAMALVGGVALGACMVFAGRAWRVLGQTTAAMLLAIPPFWLGSMILLGSSLYAGWLPPLGYQSLWSDPGKHAQQTVLPVLALSGLFIGACARISRASLLEALRSEHITVARAKGLGGPTLFRRHQLRNALLPLTPLIGVYGVMLVGGSVVVEEIFSLPGMGRSLVRAMSLRDFPVIQSYVLVYATIAVFLNALSDALLAVADPRLRT